MFKKELKSSSEIAEYIFEIATGWVDEDLILEYFIGCRAILKKVAISKLKTKNSYNHLRNKKKEKVYERLPIKTMPPLIIEKGIVVDGNHRLRAAKKEKTKRSSNLRYNTFTE